MYHLYYKKITSIVTGVTGLLRAFSPPRNTVKALPHLHYRHPVTAVTGLCTRAHGRNFLFAFIYSILCQLNISPREVIYPVTLVTPVTIIVFIKFF